MSLRIRLLLAVGAVALIALLVADVATYSALRSFLFTQIDQSLVVPQRPSNGDNGNGGPDKFPVNPSPTSHQFFPRSPILGGFREVRSSSGKVIQSIPTQVNGHSYTPQLPKHITGFTIQPDGIRAVYFTTSAVQSGGPSFRVRASVLTDGNLFIVAAPLDATNSTLNRLLIIEVTVTGVALLAAVLLGWWLVRVGLRPLEEVERTAESIAEGELDHRVPGENTKTEVGRMARTINIMLSRIQRAFAERDATEAELRASEGRLRQFVADASHELRTPVSAVSAYAEMYQLGMAKSGPELDRAMSGISLESARMGHLVEDLLTLARLDEGLPLEQRQVELVKLSADAVHTAAAVGPDWPVRLEAARPVEVTGDPLRLRQVLDNLLSNVRAHTPIGTTTVVRVSQTDDEAIVEVADNGPGLDDEQRSRVFERFYRADPSRSRLKGGAGLGLSIVSAIVSAHGGTVRAVSLPGQGASFAVHLPLSHDDSGPALDSVVEAETGAESSS
ncbi:MAG TPA: HAMP domain-containing sensor histidine kinase [Acidimicrobiales bacterium]|nr:HAMP domain-containing sensor histidine kinase [Acidimicrobiales bacterium]